MRFARRAASALARTRFGGAGVPRPSSPILHALLVEKNARLAEKDERLEDAKARLAFTVRDKDERLAEKDERLTDTVRTMDARLTDTVRTMDARLADTVRTMDARLADAGALLFEVRKSAVRDLALAKHDADVARSVVDARGLFEACVAELASQLVNAGRKPPGIAQSSVSARLALLFTDCPEFVAYLNSVAADNSVPSDVLLRQAKKLYDVLSERLHATKAGGGPVDVSVALFERSGHPTLVAFAALVHFAGRDLRLYNFDRSSSSVKLGIPPRIA